MRRRRYNGRGEGGGFKIIAIVALLALIGAGVMYLVRSGLFERNAPTMNLANSVAWNLKDPIKLHLSDDSGIKSVKIYLNDGITSHELYNAKLDIPHKELDLDVNAPAGLISGDANYTLGIDVRDTSKWNFMLGNRLKAELAVMIDTKKPEIYVLANSYEIKRGGAAAVVFRATDDNLREVYVQTSDGRQFKALKYLREGFWASIVAWDVLNKDFEAQVIATDAAGNTAKSRIGFIASERKFRDSTLALTEKFMGGKVADLAEQYAPNAASMGSLERFLFVNETLRNQNGDYIHDLSRNVPESSIEKFPFERFKQLEKSQAVANYGDHRFYTLDDKQVSESWHLGLDLASTANAPIYASVPGSVVAAGDNGIYGQMVLLYHGFGVYSLYAHCSDVKVSTGDEVKDGDLIANTGASGFAFGDHLHFGVLVQGVEVYPQEWLDPKWIKTNITEVLEKAQGVAKE